MVIAKRIKLYIPDEMALDLERFTNLQIQASNYFMEKIRESGDMSLFSLHKAYYFEVSEKYGIGGELTTISLNLAIKVARLQRKSGRPITSLSSKILFIKNSYVKGNTITLPLGDKIKRVVKWGGKIMENQRLSSMSIKKIKNEWFGFIPIKIDGEKIKKYKRCMGVDLGVSKIAVVADWNGNNTKFFRGEPLRFVKNHYRGLRKSMQENLKKGNTYKALNNIRGKESRWVQDMNHKISHEIVDIAVKNKRSIAIENLTGITERLKFNKKTNNMMKNWSFNQLAQFIKYKAQMVGIQVIEVDPRGTSKTCSQCGHCSRSNRRTQERFICRACGYESNADRNAAINIAKRGTELLACR